MRGRVCAACHYHPKSVPRRCMRIIDWVRQRTNLWVQGVVTEVRMDPSIMAVHLPREMALWLIENSKFREGDRKTGDGGFPSGYRGPERL